MFSIFVPMYMLVYWLVLKISILLFSNRATIMNSVVFHLKGHQNTNIFFFILSLLSYYCSSNNVKFQSKKYDYSTR